MVPNASCRVMRGRGKRKRWGEEAQRGALAWLQTWNALQPRWDGNWGKWQVKKYVRVKCMYIGKEAYTVSMQPCRVKR